MTENVIDVDNLTIRFNLASEKVNNLKEYAIKLAKHELLFQEFLALKDVDLHVKRGEAWGLIGTNGSGKSTLLKTITGILKPYRGTVRVRGQIAPMIELGAGFDRELTARENIFLNGAVLGHSRKYMAEHFDQIVDFAGVEKFLDSPIKNFSSGMKARLGFAVATTVAADILIVDEVLAVGDANFQKKCRQRMEELLAGGTTLLFVSHNINDVKSLCDHALWLDHGDPIMSGDSQIVCGMYTARQEQIFKTERKAIAEQKAKETGRKYDYLVVGAGLYGAVFAREAYEAGKRCLVIDKRDHIGGNCYTEKYGDINVHKYGAHIFHTSNEEVWEYVNRYAKFNNYINAPVARYRDEQYNLPFNMNTFHQMWGVKTPQEAKDMIKEQVEQLHITQPANLEEQALSLVGTDIYEKLIKGYTEKQWGRDCRDLPAFIIRRLPLRFTYDNNYFNDQYQGIPEGGYTSLIAGLLEDIDVLLGVDYKTYLKNNPDNFEKVIYTGAIDEYFDYCKGYLQYRTVEFETEELDQDNFQGNAVVNYTDREVPWTRIIEHKHFEFADTPTTIISREYSREWKPGMEPYYPVNDEKNMALFKEYLEMAEKEDHVVFGGRLGSYRYMDMDQVIAEALKMSKAVVRRRGTV